MAKKRPRGLCTVPYEKETAICKYRGIATGEGARGAHPPCESSRAEEFEERGGIP